MRSSFEVTGSGWLGAAATALTLSVALPPAFATGTRASTSAAVSAVSGASGPSGVTTAPSVSPSARPSSEVRVADNSPASSEGRHAAAVLPPITTMSNPMVLGPDERLITILQTNDIHGGVEPTRDPRTGAIYGGMALWSGVVRSFRMGLQQQFGDRGGVLLLDAGDQFQGTLVSNFNEGQLVFSAMSLIGYDAVIPGNHDYDFGPTGWLDDQVNASNPDKNPRGALMRAAANANFPLLSANTYFRDSFFEFSGARVATDMVGCRTTTPPAHIDWRRLRTLPFLRPFTIKVVAGVRVAMIGLDNPETPLSTTIANVSDLCFDNPVTAYRRTRAALEGMADVFVAVIHDGNTHNSDGVSRFVREVRSTPQFSLDAVVAGHTHYVNSLMEAGVPIVQSGSGGRMFGRIDLVFNTTFRRVNPAKTRFQGGLTLGADRCAPEAATFCRFEPSTQSLFYEGIQVTLDPRIVALVNQAKAAVAPVALRKLGVVEGGPVAPARSSESPLADLLTDYVRAVSNADVAILNAGGLRRPLYPGDVTYGDLFEVLPFNNHGLIIGPMPATRLVDLMAQSIRSCGVVGALMPSGIRVIYERNCREAVNQWDMKARLLTVTTDKGEVLYDAEHHIAPNPQRTFQVITFDFLAAGGEGFTGFRETPVISDIGILREALTTYLLGNPMHATPATDGRLLEKVRPSTSTGTRSRTSRTSRTTRTEGNGSSETPRVR